MRVIYKLQLEVCDSQIFEMPILFKPLHIDWQRGKVCLWYECDNESPKQMCEIRCFGTGHPMPSEGTPGGVGNIEYIGTVLQDGGFFVWHYYYRWFQNKSV